MSTVKLIFGLQKTINFLLKKLNIKMIDGWYLQLVLLVSLALLLKMLNNILGKRHARWQKG